MFLPADESTDFTLVDNEATYPECDSVQECTVERCINIELQDDMDIEGQEEFEIEIRETTLGAIGLSTTTVFINDATGEHYRAEPHSLIEIEYVLPTQ